jgi:AraC family transcriptional regulator of adaptative response/methylated-DNA-[protein]-cysteine methyltransferase
MNISYSWQKALSNHLDDQQLFLRCRDQQNDPVDIYYGTGQSWFGECLIATTVKGICWLDLAPHAESLNELQLAWRGCRLVPDQGRARHLAALVFADSPARLPAHLCGSDFQLDVWRGLTRIEPGNCMTYSQLARCIGRPDSARAVGGAVGANAIAFLIPCHRVLPASGVLGSYRWGAALKEALLQWEQISAVA